MADRYLSLEDPYQKARRADVQDAGNQVLVARDGESSPGEISLPGPVILFAEELTPGEISQLEGIDSVVGLVTASGDKTADSAILAARPAMGLPALSGIDLAGLDVQPGTLVAVDGFSGLLWIDPGPDVQQELTARRQQWMEEASRLLRSSHQPAVMRTGRRIEEAANVGSLADARAARLEWRGRRGRAAHRIPVPEAPYAARRR